MQDLFAQLPLSLVLPIFAVAAALVWVAGQRLPRLAAEIARRTGIGQAFGGLLVLGGITSLPELATTTSAAAIGAQSLALNNILGSVSFNLLLLAIADATFGKGPLTALVAKPSTLMQAALGMILLALVAAAVAAGDVAIAGVGAWSTILFGCCLGAMWIAFQYERTPGWSANGASPEATSEDRGGGSAKGMSGGQLALATTGLAAVIFAAGTVLSVSGNSIAERSGLGRGLVGWFLVAGATSLPELSAIFAATRLRAYELAIGEIFGSNLFNLSIIFVIDAVASGPPVLATSGRFEIIASMLGVVLTGIFAIGLLERRDRRIFRMGLDSLAVLLIYAAGATLLWRMSLGLGR